MSAATAAVGGLVPPKLLQRLLWAVTWIVTAVSVVAVLGVVVVALILPLVTGGSARSVRSGSMEPALPTGSLVLDRPVGADTLRVGDIATYVRSDHQVVTHRIVAIQRTKTGETFTFRGDANPTPDPQPVSAVNVQGRVWLHVPVLGTVGTRLASSKWVLIGIAVVVLAAYAVRQAAGGLREIRRNR